MSVSFLARDVVDWTGGELLQGQETARFDGVSIDSRTVAPGQLFVAIQGPTHDGHLFVEGALSAGAAGLLIQRGRALPVAATPAPPVIAVDDTTRSLGEDHHQGNVRGDPLPIGFLPQESRKSEQRVRPPSDTAGA
jgi:UDP-N-acetylmuramoyl-tripeptide--D-alanyl-D-alanine ligase